MAQDRFVEALSLLKRLCQAAASTPRNGDLVKYLVWRSLAHQALAQPDLALSTFNQALVLAEPEGYVRSFVDEGEPMVDLLRAAALQGLATDYVASLLAAFGEATTDDRQRACPEPAEGTKDQELSAAGLSSSPLVEPFSERELQVLRLLKTELSGPEIARELVVSVSTVRYHTRNIYGKLGVHNRRQAVARAESLGLL